jgi:hypothetical protein
MNQPPSSGIEGNPVVFYRLIRGSTAQTNKYDTFYLQQRQDNGFTWADIKVNHPLDFETNKEYNLTIRVEVSHRSQTLCFVSNSIGSRSTSLHDKFNGYLIFFLPDIELSIHDFTIMFEMSLLPVYAE